jgi:hypothetical protein
VKEVDALTDAVWQAAHELAAEFQGDFRVLEKLIGGSILADCLRRMSVEERGALFARCAAYTEGRKDGRASMRKRKGKT